MLCEQQTASLTLLERATSGDGPLPSCEKVGAEQSGSFLQYLGSLQQKGSIKSFDAVFLTPHGGDLNGFILIRCEPNQLDALMASSELVTRVTRGAILLDGLRGERRDDQGAPGSLEGAAAAAVARWGGAGAARPRSPA